MTQDKKPSLIKKVLKYSLMGLGAFFLLAIIIAILGGSGNTVQWSGEVRYTCFDLCKSGTLATFNVTIRNIGKDPFEINRVSLITANEVNMAGSYDLHSTVYPSQSIITSEVTIDLGTVRLPSPNVGNDIIYDIVLGTSVNGGTISESKSASHMSMPTNVAPNDHLTQDSKPSADNIIEKSRKSVVLINYNSVDIKGNRTAMQGSGIIFGADGSTVVVLTNRHVIDCLFAGQCGTRNSEAITIKTSVGNMYNANKVSYAQHGVDLAMVQFSKMTDDFSVAIMDISYLPKVGEEVIAVGSPLGLEGSVSKGIISNDLRQVSTSDGFLWYAIQTTAQINPGNSGGGLFSLSNGKLLGINTLKISSIGIEGLGFAISTRTVSDTIAKFFSCSEGYYPDKEAAGCYRTFPLP